MKVLKRGVLTVVCAATAAMCGFGLSACMQSGEEGDFSYTVAMPDGAPALAVAHLMVEDTQFGGEVNAVRRRS